MTAVGPFDTFRHCPRCGSQSLRRPALKLLTCEGCGFRYYTNAAAAVMGILRNERGEVLLIRRGREPAKGKWNLPGGFVDPLETIEDALARELREEVGVSITGWDYLASFPNRYEYGGVLYFTIDLAFVCAAGEFSPRAEGDEITEFRFVSPAEIDPAEIAFESGRKAIEAYRACPGL